MNTAKLLAGVGLATACVALANFILPPDVPRGLVVTVGLTPLVLLLFGALLTTIYMAVAVKGVQLRALAAAGFHLESRGAAGGYIITAKREAQQSSGFFNRLMFAMDKGKSLQSLYVVYSLEHRKLGDVGSLSIVPKHLRKHIHFHKEPKSFAAITYQLMAYWSDFGDSRLADFMYENQLDPHHMYVWYHVPEEERQHALELPPELIMTLYKGEKQPS